MIKAVHPIFNRVFKTYDKLNNVVQENLSGIRVVKSFNRQDHEIQKFEGTSQKIYEDFSKAEKIMGELKIAESRRLKGLGERQEAALLERLG